MLEHDPCILLVEDHPFQLVATQCLLKSFGFHQLTTTNSAENAIQLMNQARRPFDILLCDQCLPDLPGLELIGLATQHGLIKQAIILSSLTSRELETLKSTATELRLPLLGYLVKPLKQSDFISLLTLHPETDT